MIGAEKKVPMPWVAKWSELIPVSGRVLDVACGDGRHAVYLAGQGYALDAVDLNADRYAAHRGETGINWLQHDLESDPWPFPCKRYQGVVVTNYLHRPLFPNLIDALASAGVLIYATFSVGQEVYGRPRNPRHLLMPGELLEMVRGHLRVVAYEDVLEQHPEPARVQRLCAVKP